MDKNQVITVEERGNRLLEKKEIADALRMSPRSVENFMRRGEIPYIRIGRLVRFSLPDVLEAVKNRGQCNHSTPREW
tara:strand:+ start:37 stop:267 length:231 start_codon:yes stop_codon:yes gene_type:complete